MLSYKLRDIKHRFFGLRLAIVLFLGCLISNLGFCAFDLIVSSDSGLGLSFSRANNYSTSLRVRVINSTGVRYRIKQFLAQPLISNNGSLISDDIIISHLTFYSIVAGSISWQPGESLSMYQKTAYLSDRAGDEVALVFHYKVNNIAYLSEGIYHSQLVLLLESEDGKNSVQKVVPITVILKKEGLIILKSSSSKTSTIYLAIKKQAFLKIINNIGAFKIIKKGNLPGLQVEVVKDKAILVPWRFLDEPIILRERGELLIACRIHGKVLAGEYKGYIVFSSLSGKDLLKIEVVENVKEEFYLDVSRYLLDLLPEKGLNNSASVLEIKIRNNTGRPYILIENPTSSNFLGKGKLFPVTYLQVRVEKYSRADNKWIEVLPWKNVTSSQMVIYKSTGNDKYGEVELRVYYRLAPGKSKKLLAGDYELNIGFSLLTK